MTTSRPDQKQSTILIVEGDVLVRHALAEYLRGCGFAVVETATALEARTVLQRGPAIDVMLADARVADGEGGFVLAQWVRRYRPRMDIILTSSLANKSAAIATLCARHHPSPPSADFLRDRINAMRARPLRGANGGARKSRAKG
ncbi:MAG TPA: response regulator [Hyphomonadaceae bacterium]|nr:response regulator [Hyphomonadaceae bacterium]